MNKILTLFVLICLDLNGFSQNVPLEKAQNITDDLWTKSPNLKSTSTDVLKRESVPARFELYRLNLLLLKEKLKSAPRRDDSFVESKVIISFPNNKGILEDFQIIEASVMESELQEKYPDIRSYIGMGIDRPGSIIRFSVSPFGVNGLLLINTQSSVLIDPYTKDGLSYMVYSKKDLPVLGKSLVNDVIDLGIKDSTNILKSSEFGGINDGKLRTFRLALATTGEYSQSILTIQGIPNNATDAIKKATVLANLNTLMTRVNAVFERDICLTMKLVVNNTDIIFLDAVTDGYTDYDGGKLGTENQLNCDQLIGTSFYDIGHVIGLNLNVNNAVQSAACLNNVKAMGVSLGLDLALVHEMGHQFGAGHTFNSCGTSGYTYNGPETTVELGCGESVMSYGASGDNIFFHSVSIQEIWKNITTGVGQCAAITTTGNLAPIANAGNDLTIPKSTPFLLEGQATDANGNLTYSWEQMDTEETVYPPVSYAIGGPVFKIIIPPSLFPNRYMPELSTTLSGKTVSESEALPSVSRILNFNFVVRDNDSRGGQIAIHNKVITVDGNSGPFIVTSHNTPETWDAGTTKTITWNVAGTNGGVINTQFVDILFSTDGGFTYPTKLASNVANDGSQDIVVPFGVKTTTGRYMIRAVNNIFFAINSANLTIEESPFLMNFRNDTIDVCLPSSSVTYDFTYNTYLEYSGTTTFSADCPSGTSATFNPTSANTDGIEVEITVSGITSSNLGKNSITISGTSSGTPVIIKTDNVSLNVFISTITPLTLSYPANGAINVSPPFTFSWNTDINAKTYTIEIATDITFLNVIETASTTLNDYISSSLKINTVYYWRVKSKNPCSDENISAIYSFKTLDIDLLTYIPDDNFQQILIDLGYDIGNIDNYVLTSNIKDIKSLNVSNHNISDLTGIQDFIGLTSLNCSSNQLSALDVTKNIALSDLFCGNNQLSILDVSNNIDLTRLSCGVNRLLSIDITKNTNLIYFECALNKLTSLDISKNMKIVTLGCPVNNLRSLDVTKNTKLMEFNCSDNNLKSLELSKNTELKYIICNKNELSYLNVKNGENGSLLEFNAGNNPDLGCIQVDNVSLSSGYLNWIKDATASYSEDCPLIPIINYLSPSAACQGDTIDILGFNFSGVINVSFGDIPAVSFSVVTQQQIKAVVGEGASGNVSVTTNFGTASIEGFNFAGLPSASGTISGNTMVCIGSSNITYVIPTIAYATTYVWTLPSGATGTSSTNSITVNYGTSATSGNITVKGTNSCGDGATSTLAITVNNKPNTPVISLNGYVLHSDAPSGNQWYVQNGFINSATNQDYTVNVNGAYYVIVTLLGCRSDASNILNVTLTGMEVTENNKTIKVYPNPVSNELIIEIEGNNKKTNFEIFNSIGQVVFNGYLIEKTIVQTNSYTPGVYLIKLENGKTFKFKKIIKQ